MNALRARRRVPAVLVLPLSVLLLAATAPLEDAPPAPIDPAGPADPTEVAATPWFIFHSDPWLNLHNVLHFQAASENAASAGVRKRLGTGPEDLDSIDRLPEEERTAWRRAVDLYRTELADRDLLFGDSMAELRDVLVNGGARRLRHEIGEGGLADLPPTLPDVLEAAGEVYRRRLWPAHDRRNREWIARAVPLVERFGPAIAPGEAYAFGGTWPEGGLRTDVAVHGSWPGAYTTNHPDLIVISSTDPGHAGTASVESLFHEALHTEAVGGGLIAAVDAAFAAAGRTAPERFWHMALFYTAGELTRRAVAVHADAGEPPYESYALRLGVVARFPGGPDQWRALDLHWRRYLDGFASRDGAMAETARALDQAARALDQAGPGND